MKVFSKIIYFSLIAASLLLAAPGRAATLYCHDTGNCYVLNESNMAGCSNITEEPCSTGGTGGETGDTGGTTGGGTTQSSVQSAVIPDCLLSSNIGTLRQCDNVNVFLWLAIKIGLYLFGFIGALALLVFVYGGILLIVSQGNQEKIKKGTSAMTAAIVGLVIAFSAYALVSFLSSTIGVAEKKGLNYDNGLSHMV